ncbi:winged helix-turn-helix transcriptional regulator [Phototrophicus methaneseepsis]|uniref:Winged helix-turn-helix transcriptional regulator n=1 Tax=Phototrophicus methaneseepsis TaxID=2710758 RepID=A0A7S8E6P2_9CHLR|nr:winged helix-turn-helix transcriptional regulator [Phototrophicus methaneseepsis]
MSIPTLEELSLLHTNICHAIGDPKRILILYTLQESPLNVTELTEKLGMPQPTVSRHLAILRERSLVQCERDGTTVTYHLADDRIISVLNIMRNVLRDIVEGAADSLSK